MKQRGRPRKNPISKLTPEQDVLVAPLYGLIGANVRRVRMVKEITQEELAEQVDVTRTSIANLERGHQRISIHTVYLTAMALDVPVERILPNLEQLKAAASAETILPFDHSVFTKEELEWMYERIASGELPHERFQDEEESE